jgi:hypothetical protein
MTYSTNTLVKLAAISVFAFSGFIHAATIQEFNDNGLAGLGDGGTGYMNPYLYIEVIDGCPTGEELRAEGSWIVGSDTSLCHSLLKGVASVGADSNFLMVNGSNSNNGRIYSQVVNTLGLNSGVFSGYFAGLYSAYPASLTLSVYDGSTSAVIGSHSFTTNVTDGLSPAAWVKQSVNYVGATGSAIVVEISLNSAYASGNDFGVDMLDVTQGSSISAESPTPEPSSFILCSGILMGLALVRKR